MNNFLVFFFLCFLGFAFAAQNTIGSKMKIHFVGSAVQGAFSVL